MIARQKKVALYLSAAEYSRRLAIGVRNYCKAHKGLLWRDFWYAPELGYIDASRGEPPWKSWKPDGLILYASEPEVDVDWIVADVPHVVSTTSDCNPEKLPVVHTDRQSVTSLAVRHFLQLERKSIAFVGVRGYQGAVTRAQHFAEEMERHGFAVRKHFLEFSPGDGVNYSREQVAKEPGLLGLLRTIAKPLAVLTTTDAAGRLVCDAALDLGLRVPEDVAVLSVGNSIFAESSVPSLSSIDPPGEEVGYQAMSLLDRLMRGAPPPREAVEVPTTRLVVRQSTAGLRQNADVERALQLLQTRPGQGLRVADLARMLSVSRSYLEREFLRVLGRTPGDEIRSARVRYAEELLGATEQPITTIAGMLGFQRTGNFSEFFRKHTGMSPRAFRQAKREEKNPNT